jgi:hypothetical protein
LINKERNGEEIMNISKKAFLTLCVLMVIATATPLQAATPEESFRKSFPDIPLESMKQTDIPGIYEIVANGRVAYYAPGLRYLIIGGYHNRREEEPDARAERRDPLSTD